MLAPLHLHYTFPAETVALYYLKYYLIDILRENENGWFSSHWKQSQSLAKTEPHPWEKSNKDGIHFTDKINLTVKKCIVIAQRKSQP